MQVPPIPTTVVPGAVPQDTLVKHMPQMLAQAAMPQTQRAVDPSPRSEGGNKSRSNTDKAKGGGKGGDGNRGGSVNIRV